MTVQCLSEQQKQNLFDDRLNMTKKELSIKYGVSARTVNRVLEEFKAPQVEETPNGKSKFASFINTIKTKVSGDVYSEEDDYDEYFDYDAWDDDVVNIDEFWGDEEDEYTFILTPDSISITRITDDAVDTVNIDEDNSNFEKVYQHIITGTRDNECLKEAYNMLDHKHVIENLTFGKIKVYPEEYRVTYENDDGSVGTFSGRLVSRIVDNARNGNDMTNLINFAHNLALNPSYRAVNELYDFLEATDIEINEDGHVVCFKRVNDNYTDCHSRTFDNSPGLTVSIPRNMVDENSNNTCSHGLHVCSKSYLPHYGGDRIVKVIVHPEDFVSIPRDYYGVDENNQVKAKARVCKYFVEGDVTDQF